MKSLMNSLSLQALFMSLAICLTDGAPYSKYGRTCKDIGCLPREVCVMAYDSCSFAQQENVSCGRYPTCKKVTDVQGGGTGGGNTQQTSGPSFPPSSPPTSRPKPDTDSIWSMPTMTTTTTRRTTTTTTTRRPLFTTKAPFYNPADPSYNGAGGYFGNRYDDRTTPRYTTKRPSSSGGGFFSGFSDILQGELGKFINSALSNRGGSGSSGFGGFDTRPVMENKNRGNFGLFNENTRGTSLSSNNDYHKYPVTRYGSESSMSASPYATTTHAPSHGNFGWKVSK